MRRSRTGGGSGQDRFVYHAADAGDDKIQDLSFAEGDVIDLTRALRGLSQYIDDYIQISNVGESPVIAFDHDGDGSGFIDSSIRLENLASDTTLEVLLAHEALLVGELELAPRVTVAATKNVASIASSVYAECTGPRKPRASSLSRRCSRGSGCPCRSARTILRST